MDHSTMFPTTGLQALSALLYFLGVTILTFFLSCRVLGEDLGSKQAWGRLTWPRICILLVFLDSYLFLFCTGILVFGVGLQLNRTACAAGIYLCITFYTTSKLLIYSFLTEKVYIVWDTHRNRLRSPVYLVCMITVVLYFAIILIMFFVGRIDQFRQGDGACVLGLKPTASLPLLSYDLYINILLTILFLWPLMRSQHSNAQLRRVAIRTLVASGVALSTSTVNMAVLTIMKGRELGWVCLASCGLDVIINAAALFWVTGGGPPINTLSGARRVTDSHCTTPNNFSLSAPPSPARGKFRTEHELNNTFKMGNMSPAVKEFQVCTISS
ncbi:hypothetical protein B0H17DRAFT_946142 [Mycena rosella]|uniref:Uncharacterized protein n=1 Tax=Mycena rosella TaxID=1033263 RepID=A0AAD7D1Z4_MYCRO|nr:hypothetical protein B0H17DRAFT_946142 [Mycena rosella]